MNNIGDDINSAYTDGFADGYKQGKKDAQPERKKGEWVEFDSDEDKYDIIKCSCCKHTFTVDSYHWTDIGFVKDDFKFCPNCGADMRSESVRWAELGESLVAGIEAGLRGEQDDEQANTNND